MTLVCHECGMRCEAADAFHPSLHCWLYKRGVDDPAQFLDDHGFQPKPPVSAEGRPDETETARVSSWE